jgi:hypothetical protein
MQVRGFIGEPISREFIEKVNKSLIKYPIEERTLDENEFIQQISAFLPKMKRIKNELIKNNNLNIDNYPILKIYEFNRGQEASGLDYIIIRSNKIMEYVIGGSGLPYLDYYVGFIV